MIAILETHGRPVTVSRIGTPETLPRRVVDYRGNRFEEMDIDAVLGTSRTNERVVAGVTPEPSTDATVRRAARIARMSKADLDVVYVTSRSGGRNPTSTSRRRATGKAAIRTEPIIGPHRRRLP